MPYSTGFTRQEYEKVAKYLNDEEFGKKLNNHISTVPYDGRPRETFTGSGYFKDDYGVVWNRHGVDKDIGVIEGYVLKDPSLDGYEMPTPDEKELGAKIRELIRADRDNFKLFDFGFTVFERAWSLRGMENILVDMIEEPDFVDRLLDEIVAYNMKMVEIAMAYGIDGVMFGDDWGQQSGLIMGPGLWRRFIKPRMAKMYACVKNKGAFVFQHSCGDIREIFPDLIEIGLDVYQTFQPEIYDLRSIKQQYGGKLSFWGGISTQKLLPFASPEEVKRVTEETLEILGKNGGYIAGPTHDLPGDVPPENVIAMTEVFKNQH
ncbi:MAG: uroporphyrinogen decarboxylase family protein [Clostridia bacterium]|nr:uroporphyrinogen decarboxylase family protein [Clostridia bacterium]